MTTRHILIAEDDRHLRDSLCEVMSAAGWEPTAADCGTQAIAQLTRTSFDLMLSDVDMPDMTGFELLAWAREHHHSEPTVLMSARANRELSQAAARAGAITLLTKPVQITEITGLVTKLFPLH